MDSVPVFVGLDYHQDAVQVCVMDRQGKVLMNRSCRNDWQVLRDAVAPLGHVQRVGIEACCGASDLTEQLVERAGWNCSLGHPAYVAKLKGSPDKSDWSDGRLLADLSRWAACLGSGWRRRISASFGCWWCIASVRWISDGRPSFSWVRCCVSSG
jgi:transposase